MAPFNVLRQDMRASSCLAESDQADWFPASYVAARARFRAWLESVRRNWPSASLHSLRLEDGEDLTIDRIEAPASRHPKKLLVLTTGEHGVEAYVGAAMLELFFREYLPLLNSWDTGLLLVNAINPWGMKHHRRVNANNVDLNRDFLFSSDGRPANSRYARIESFLNPSEMLHSWLKTNLAFGAGALSALSKLGLKGALGAILLGQYQFPSGLYFGGDRPQAETRHLIELFQQWFPAYEQLLLLDMHTGYGPRLHMSLVNSYLEPRSSAALAERFAYAPVVKANQDEFYAIQGDMIDFVYALQNREFPEKTLYATSFEFGTYGDSLFDHLHELRTMILENQVYHFGAGSPELRRRVADDFQALYYPQAAGWQVKAIRDARRAFSGILKAEGYIQGPSQSD